MKDEDKTKVELIAELAQIRQQLTASENSRQPGDDLSARYLAAIVESSDDAIIAKNLDGRITSWNRAAERLYGYTASEAIGQNINFIVPEELRGELRQILDNIKRSHPIVRLETVRVTKDGRRIDVSLSISPIKDEQGQITGAAAIAHDITARKQLEATVQESKVHTAALAHANEQLQAEVAERKQAEQALRESEEQLRAIIAALPDPGFVFDAQGRYVEILISRQHPNYESAARMKNRFLHEEEAEDTAALFMSALQQTIETGQSQTVEYMRESSTWGQRWWEGRTVPMESAPGAPRQVVWIARDITQQKQAEEELAQERTLLRTLIDSLPDKIFIKDTQGRYLLVNEVYARFMGVASPEEVIGKTDFDFYPSEMAAIYRANDQKVMQESLAVLEDEVPIVDKAGNQHWYLEIKAPLRNGEGEIVGIVGAGRDITERKQAEEELAQERNLLRTVIDSLPNHIYAKDHTHRIILANAALARFRGTTAQAMTGKSNTELSGEEAALEYERRDKLALTGQTVSIREEPAVDEDGNPLWFTISRVPLYDAQGKIVGVVGINTDITEHKQAKEELRQHQEQLEELVASRTEELKQAGELLSQERNLLRTLIDSLPDNIFLKDPQGRYLLVNKTYVDYLGVRSQDDILGKTDFDFFPSELAELYVAEDQKVYQKAQPILDREMPIVNPDGSHGWHLDIKAPLRDGEGQLIGIVGAGRNITARKQAEAALQESEANLAQAQRLSHLGSWEMDIATGKSTWSDEFFRICGYEPGAIEPTAEIGMQLIHPDDRDRAAAAVNEAIETGKPYNIEKRIVRPDGSIRHVHSMGEIVYDEQQQPVRLIGSFLDITNRKQAELAVAEKAAELEAANQELESFSYSVSHDLRAPLRAIDGFSRILLDEYAPQLPPEAQRYLDLVRGSTQRMSKLIDGLLIFSRLGRKELEKQTITPADLVHEVLQDLEDAREGRQVEINVGELPPCRADPTLLTQVYANLLSNALKFTQEREVATIEVGHQSLNGESVYFIKDNGAGFDMRYADKLFGVFQRLHSLEEYEGTGVGTAIVQRVIQRHGGRVWAEAEVDKGATFYFTLGGEQTNE